MREVDIIRWVAALLVVVLIGGCRTETAPVERPTTLTTTVVEAPATDVVEAQVQEPEATQEIEERDASRSDIDFSALPDPSFEPLEFLDAYVEAKESALGSDPPFRIPVADYRFPDTEAVTVIPTDDSEAVEALKDPDNPFLVDVRSVALDVDGSPAAHLVFEWDWPSHHDALRGYANFVVGVMSTREGVLLGGESLGVTELLVGADAEGMQFFYYQGNMVGYVLVMDPSEALDAMREYVSGVVAVNES